MTNSVNTMQKIVISVLIIAIVFSIFSITLNLYVFNLAPYKAQNSAGAAGVPNANVNLVVEGNSEPSGGGR